LESGDSQHQQLVIGYCCMKLVSTQESSLSATMTSLEYRAELTGTIGARDTEHLTETNRTRSGWGLTLRIEESGKALVAGLPEPNDLLTILNFSIEKLLQQDESRCIKQGQNEGLRLLLMDEFAVAVWHYTKFLNKARQN
jgi:hypothetical protein